MSSFLSKCRRNRSEDVLCRRRRIRVCYGQPGGPAARELDAPVGQSAQGAFETDMEPADVGGHPRRRKG